MNDLWGICGIEKERWDALKEHHSTLSEIYDDYRVRSDELNNVAISLSAFLQRMPGVHSVRWRIKSAEHLIAKICRKKEAGVDKYKEVTVENYRNVIADLLGIRVLHLMKEDFSRLHNEIISTWDLGEEPVAYLRDGDHQDLRELYEKLGVNVENHADGYRSVHYIIMTNFTKTSIKCELQVRTIFEEGWSEIDHLIRYPDFTDEPLVLEFVNIFNRLSGAADEMGTFAMKLAKDIKSFREENAKNEAETAKHLEELSAKIDQLERANATNESLRKELSEIKSLATKVRDNNLEDSVRSRVLFHSPIAEKYQEQVSRRRSSGPTRRSLDNIAAIKLGFSAESFDEVASTSKRSISESVAKRKTYELERRAEIEKLISERKRNLDAKSRSKRNDDQES